MCSLCVQYCSLSVYLCVMLCSCGAHLIFNFCIHFEFKTFLAYREYSFHLLSFKLIQKVHNFTRSSDKAKILSKNSSSEFCMSASEV